MISTDTSLRTVDGLADNLAICDFSNIEIAEILLFTIARAEKAEAAARESALQELASIEQAAEAYTAQLKAEAERDALQAEVDRLRAKP